MAVFNSLLGRYTLKDLTTVSDKNGGNAWSVLTAFATPPSKGARNSFYIELQPRDECRLLHYDILVSLYARRTK